MFKAIFKVGEDGSDIELPNGKVVSVDRDEDSLTVVETVLKALGVEVEWTDRPPYRG